MQSMLCSVSTALSTPEALSLISLSSFGAQSTKKKSTKNNTCYIYWLSEPQIVSKRLQNHCIPNDFYSFFRNILGTFFPVNKLYCVVSLRPQFVLLSLAVQTIESVLHQEEIVERKLMNLKMRCHGVDPLSDGFEIWLFPALRWLSQ